MNLMRYLFIPLLVFIFVAELPAANAISESNYTVTGDGDTLNWYKKDPVLDGVEGTSVERAYQELPLKFDGPKIIVAVIDNGVDFNHEELKDRIWKNEDELPGNGVDDDNNGYVDDVRGWNFLGGKNGKSIGSETVEMTREVVRYKKLKESGTELSPEKEKYYKKILERYEREVTTPSVIVETLAPIMEQIEEAKAELEKKYGITDFSKDSLTAWEAPDNEGYLLRQKVRIPRDFLLNEQSQGMFHFYKSQLETRLNPDFNTRSEIVGDDPSDINDTDYGNNDVLGENGDHGTYVSGIIAANRTNDVGSGGILDHVIIMPLNVVPGGDERDKDIALAIRYAVDNGAQIINMSFCKPYSPYKEWVDDAVRYAEEHGVLLVHGSGNDADNSDEIPIYPSQFPLDGGEPFTNYINVGATTKDKGEMLVSDFSNYGKTWIDIYAPGTDLYGPITVDGYMNASGTSAASPVVAGIAALLLTQDPDLEPHEIRDILMKTSRKYDGLMVKVPGGGEAPFSELSVSGGIVDAYAALKYVLENK